MIKKGGCPSPVQVNKGMKGYNVWVYKNSETHPDGVIRHHYKTLTSKGKYYRKNDAYCVGWDYIKGEAYWHVHAT